MFVYNYTYVRKRFMYLIDLHMYEHILATTVRQTKCYFLMTTVISKY